MRLRGIFNAHFFKSVDEAQAAMKALNQLNMGLTIHGKYNLESTADE